MTTGALVSPAIETLADLHARQRLQYVSNVIKIAVTYCPTGGYGGSHLALYSSIYTKR